MSVRKEIKIDFEKAIDLDWTKEKENWNSYTLADGTELKIKLVLKGVKRLAQHLPDGKPIYVVNSDNVVRSVKVPKKLIKIPKDKKQVGRV